MTYLHVCSVAAPILEALSERAEGSLLGVGSQAAYVDVGGFVVAITPRGVPRMPNGVSLAGGLSALMARPNAGRVHVRPGRLEVGGAVMAWDRAAPPIWQPRVAEATPTTVQPLTSKLHAAAHALGDWQPEGLWLLGEAIRSRDPDAARIAGQRLVGRGPGLTPQGDDLVAGAALVVHAFGPAAGWEAIQQEAWLRALLPARLRARTTTLSATLLDLAVRGDALEPIGQLVDPAAGDLLTTVARLSRVGHSTGRAYVAAMAVSACALLVGCRSRARLRVPPRDRCPQMVAAPRPHTTDAHVHEGHRR